VNPGVYYGGLDLKGTVTMNPGIYVMAGGGFKYSNGSTVVTGNGVMIYNTKSDGTSCNGNLCDIGAITSSGNPTIYLTSISSGYYQGIVIYQARLSDGVTSEPTLALQGGNSNNSLIDGLIYAVDAELDFQGGINVVGNVLVGNMQANGNVGMGGTSTNTPLIAQQAPFTQIVAWKDI
jgi:hypothetical protein